MPFLKSQDMTIHYRAVGNPKGPSLMFVHGWAASTEWWTRQVPLLSKDYQLVLMDLPGHGLSSGSSFPQGISTLASVLDTVVNEAGVENPVIIGWSLGGMVSLQYTLDHPKTVSALILVDTLPHTRVFPSLGLLPTIPSQWVPDLRQIRPLLKLSARFLDGLLSVIYKLYSRRGIAALLVHLMATGKHPDKRLVSWCTNVLLQHLNIRALLQIMVAMVEFDVTNRLNEIQVPTLIIHGDEDRLISLEYADLLHHHLADSRLRVIEGVGHSPHLEKPQEFNTIMIDFLNQLDRLKRFKQ